MKKFILPLLLLLFVGSIMAVESEPSAVVGYVKYDLVAGNNTIALPMVQSYAMAGEIGNAFGATAVGYFNPATQLWTTALKTMFGTWTNNFAVSNGMPLWLNVAAASTFYSLGDLPETDPTYSLVSGNNTVMVPLSSSDLTTSALVGGNIPGATAIGYFNAATQLWTTSLKTMFGTWTNGFATSIGDPLWINTNSAGSWPSPPSREEPGTIRATKKVSEKG